MLERRLKPAPGRKVPLEDGSPWPAEGKTVPVTLYVRRRLADGDVVDVPDDLPSPPVEPAAAPEPPAEPEHKPEIDEPRGRAGKTGGKP